VDGVTSDQKAEQLGLTRGRVLVLARQGRFKSARKIGRDWIFDADELPDKKQTARGPQMQFYMTHD
jgi:ribosomal protein L1